MRWTKLTGCCRKQLHSRRPGADDQRHVLQCSGRFGFVGNGTGDKTSFGQIGQPKPLRRRPEPAHGCQRSDSPPRPFQSQQTLSTRAGRPRPVAASAPRPLSLRDSELPTGGQHRGSGCGVGYAVGIKHYGNPHGTEEGPACISSSTASPAVTSEPPTNKAVCLSSSGPRVKIAP